MQERALLSGSATLLAAGFFCFLAAACLVPQTSGICDFSRLDTDHESVALDAVVRWLPEEKKCMPDICSDLQLGDIPDLSGFLPASLFCALNTYDSAHALEHLRGKYIVLFGDSTMQENVYDLIIILSGISKDRAAMDSFMNTSIWLPWQDSDFVMELPTHSDATDQMLVRQQASFGIITAGLAAIGLPTVLEDAQRLWSHK